jgi:hypothetical protein
MDEGRGSLIIDADDADIELRTSNKKKCTGVIVHATPVRAHARVIFKFLL